MQLLISRIVIAITLLTLWCTQAWGAGKFDGPAELPRATVASAVANTPANGSIISVKPGDDLQAVLDNAFCGDTIELQAGATFKGRFTLRAKACDNQHWIIIRTSAPNSALPAEGQRVTPCYAGVASLPGRPKYNCSNPQKVLARVENDVPADGPFFLRAGANHYRFIGLEITRTTGTRVAPTLIRVEPGETADHIVVDRSWVHGTARDDTRVGINLTGVSDAAVVDSYFNDFHCTSGTGMCTDAHAVGGGLGNYQDGPFKISGNFLEASGESVMFGGGAATKTPADIEIRRNHFFKPWSWMPGNPNYVGGFGGNPFVVKNHLELKNAARVLIEANIMENNWGGFTQSGYAVLFTPKNQHTQRNGNVCPLCQVTDVTLRYLRISHAGGGIVFVTGCDLGCEDPKSGQAKAGARFSIHDVVLDDISKKYIGGGNLFLVMNGWERNPVNTITINHVTGFPDADAHLLMVANQRTNPDMYGFVFTNNLFATGRFPVWSASGRRGSCAARGTPRQIIEKCFATNSFKQNALIGCPDAFPPSSWPVGNYFPGDANAAGIVDFNNGDGGDYSLDPKSKYKGAGTDGRDLGADIVGLEAALAGVD